MRCRSQQSPLSRAGTALHTNLYSTWVMTADILSNASAQAIFSIDYFVTACALAAEDRTARPDGGFEAHFTLLSNSTIGEDGSDVVFGYFDVLDVVTVIEKLADPHGKGTFAASVFPGAISEPAGPPVALAVHEIV